MFRELHRYPSYHHPIDWLEAVPAHWVRRRFGTVLREKDVRSVAGEEQLLRVSQYTGVTERRTASGEGVDSRSETLIGYKKVVKRQLVVNIMLAWNGSLGVSRYDGIVSPAYCVYSFKENAEPWYFHHLLRSPQFKARIKANSRGIVDSRLRLYSEDLYRLEAIVPPVEEQAAIVKYLAHANARIDRAIAAKRRLVALLREEATAASRGIFAELNAPILRAKDACLRIIDCKNRTPDYVEGGGFHVVRTTCVRAGKFSLEGSYPTDAENFATWTQRGIPEFGDVFFTREAPAGEAALVPEGIDVCLGQRMMLYRPDPLKIRSEYFMHAIYDEPARRFISLATNGSTVGHLRVGDIGAIPVRVPELSVQDEVLKKIRYIVSTTAQAVDRIEQEIALLQEFRTRLVADVVTGQVDVRAIAATLPDAPESFDNTGSATDDDLEEALSEGEE